MNNYNNQFGCHNPVLTEPMFKRLNEGVKGARFEDSSWHHDLTDSATNMKRDVHIFFPNSDVCIPEEEEFDTFFVSINDLVFTDKESIHKSFNTVDEVIEYVQKYINEFDKNDTAWKQ